MFGRSADNPALVQRRSLRIRRLIGVLLIMAMVWGLIWLIFISGIADPVIEAAKPVYHQAAAMINDPLGIDWADKLVAIMAIAIPHIGMLALFDDSLR